jgi:CDP-paratose 2-epimerase
MQIALITGSAGLVGSEAVRFFAPKMDLVIGTDNDQRAYFFGETASIQKSLESLKSIENYEHYDYDIRSFLVKDVFKKYGNHIKLIIHTAAQPSHDWAAKEPLTDFSINATGTLRLLELTRQFCPGAVFIFTSTNKVYGDTPNSLPLTELETRFEYEGEIDESMTIDNSKHSLFGVSKVAADLLCQEYGKYFGLKTGIFRGGCLTGPNHSGAQLHGFLSYLVKCAIKGDRYTIFGYKGKQVRDNIHAFDLVSAFDHYYKNPKQGEVYNIGGGRFSNCSVLEAIKLIEELTGEIDYEISETQRVGDHKWYISDVSKFKRQYPEWNYKYTLEATIKQIYEQNKL